MFLKMNDGSSMEEAVEETSKELSIQTGVIRFVMVGYSLNSLGELEDEELIEI